ncbi:MAG: discoidin domain-containing protein [Oscillospiraceae bacterium]|nr:discoidin domain-containing protein [Oscillospiraceae bacterium]
MKKTLIIIFAVIIAISAAASVIAYFALPGAGPSNLNLTVVEAPDQSAPQWPPAVYDPSENWINPPDGANIAEGKPAVSGEHTEVYSPENVTDGSLTSYWESNGYPGEVTINLEAMYTIQTVCVRLNPSSLWEARSQAFEVHISGDGVNFTEIVPNDMHDFDPITGNIVRVDFEPVSAQYVRFIFTRNTASRTNGAQAAELMVFE